MKIALIGTDLVVPSQRLGDARPQAPAQALGVLQHLVDVRHDVDVQPQSRAQVSATCSRSRTPGCGSKST